jgi:hypothetical protein
MKKLFLSRSNPFGDIKEDKAVSTAKINLNMQAFNSDDKSVQFLRLLLESSSM